MAKHQKLSILLFSIRSTFTS
uniref:Uncharacterized protein n=1 Tax=Rhizophora mucronata TaxID=61149 RepID=A0A2P2QAL2_RHIMU